MIPLHHLRRGQVYIQQYDYQVGVKGEWETRTARDRVQFLYVDEENQRAVVTDPGRPKFPGVDVGYGAGRWAVAPEELFLP